MTNPHLALTPEREGPDPAVASVVVVLVHGRDQDPGYMRTEVLERLDWPGAAYVLPRAEGRSWYPASFLEPLEVNEPRLGNALAAMTAIQDDLARVGIAPHQTVWIGFSQGAVLLSEFVWRASECPGAVAILTGGLAGPPGSMVQRIAARGRSPGRRLPLLYLGTSDVDELVPLRRVVETAGAFGSIGARVTMEVFPGLEHEICGDEIAACRRLLDAIAASAGVP